MPLRDKAFYLLKHLAINGGFLFQCQGIGARGGGHTIEAECAPAISFKRDVSAYRWLGGEGELFAEYVGGFLPRSNNGLALGNVAE